MLIFLKSKHIFWTSCILFIMNLLESHTILHTNVILKLLQYLLNMVNFIMFPFLVSGKGSIHLISPMNNSGIISVIFVNRSNIKFTAVHPLIQPAIAYENLKGMLNLQGIEIYRYLSIKALKFC